MSRMLIIIQKQCQPVRQADSDWQSSKPLLASSPPPTTTTQTNKKKIATKQIQGPVQGLPKLGYDRLRCRGYWKDKRVSSTFCLSFFTSHSFAHVGGGNGFALLLLPIISSYLPVYQILTRPSFLTISAKDVGIFTSPEHPAINSTILPSQPLSQLTPPHPNLKKKKERVLLFSHCSPIDTL